MYLDKVKKVIEHFKNNYKNKHKLRFHPFYQQIIKETDFLPDKCPTNRRFWHILNNTKTIPKCSNINCNNQIIWDNGSNLKYRNYCSIKCSRTSTEVKDKYKQTCLDKYGVENPSQSIEVKDKYKQTCLDKYGVENPSQSKIIKEKKKQTYLKNYGFETNLQSKIIKDEIKQTCLDKYGVEYVTQRHLSKETLNKLKDKEWLIDQHHNQKKTLIQISKELKLSNGSVLGKRFYKYNIEVLTHASSKDEKELADYIKSIYSNKILTNTYKIINPLELDIYLPKEKLAFEFNGLYWHSVIKKDKIYHFNKSKLCADKNIKLIHIFENEWEENKEEIKYWINKYINKDTDFITKDLLIKDLKNDLDLSLNWPINYNKLEELGYILINRSAPEEQILGLDNKNKHKIYDCGKIRYSTHL